jgi:hypothetical protein
MKMRIPTKPNAALRIRFRSVKSGGTFFAPGAASKKARYRR